VQKQEYQGDQGDQRFCASVVDRLGLLIVSNGCHPLTTVARPPKTAGAVGDLLGDTLQRAPPSCGGRLSNGHTSSSLRLSLHPTLPRVGAIVPAQPARIPPTGTGAGSPNETRHLRRAAPRFAWQSIDGYTTVQ